MFCCLSDLFLRFFVPGRHVLSLCFCSPFFYRETAPKEKGKQPTGSLETCCFSHNFSVKSFWEALRSSFWRCDRFGMRNQTTFGRAQMNKQGFNNMGLIHIGSTFSSSLRPQYNSRPLKCQRDIQTQSGRPLEASCRETNTWVALGGPIFWVGKPTGPSFGLWDEPVLCLHLMALPTRPCSFNTSKPMLTPDLSRSHPTVDGQNPFRTKGDTPDPNQAGVYSFGVPIFAEHLRVPLQRESGAGCFIIFGCVSK